MIEEEGNEEPIGHVIPELAAFAALILIWAGGILVGTGATLPDDKLLGIGIVLMAVACFTAVFNTVRL